MNQERAKAIITIVVTAGVNIANVMGYAYDLDPILNGVLSVFSFICIVYSWWKNQNVTEEAQQAQVVLDELKAKHRAEADRALDQTVFDDMRLSYKAHYFVQGLKDGTDEEEGGTDGD